MYYFVLFLAAAVAFSASIPTEGFNTEESISSNLIGYENDIVEGLTPPVIEARNYFHLEPAKKEANSAGLYIVELHKSYIVIKTTGLPDQKIQLNKTESDGIQKLSLDFLQLLNSSKLSTQSEETEIRNPEFENISPVITISNAGISLFFQNTTKEVDAPEMTPTERQILWDFLTQFARNVFEEKLKELKLAQKFAEVFDSPTDATGSFQNFQSFIWTIMKLSINYAEVAFQGWTTSKPETTIPVLTKKAPSTSVTLFAFEELEPFHQFPSQEFQNRRKDLDSIFYGRGVI